MNKLASDSGMRSMLLAAMLVPGFAWAQAAATPSAAQPAQPAASAAVQKFMAGVQPDRRPQGAPVMAARTVDEKLLARWMTGVSKPWPGNVEQIAKTGGWFVPLRHPGMTGPYDIRGWHVASKP